MYIFNTTFVCDDARIEEFLIWANAEFIPSITKSGMATDAQLAHVLPVDDGNEGEAESFSIQVKIKNEEDLQIWMGGCYQPILNKVGTRFGDKVLCFSTVLEVLPINNFN